MSTATTVRLNVSLPKPIVEALKRNMRARTASGFIAAAIEEKLAREQREEAWNHFLTLPPTLTQIADPVQWVDDLRAEDEERLKHLEL